MRKIVVLIISFLFISPALAQELPKFDPPAHCKAVSEVGGQGSSNMIYNGCINMEQRAYNEIKADWESIATKIKKHCIDVAKVGGDGSYSTLKGCISMELKAANNKSEFKF